MTVKFKLDQYIHQGYLPKECGYKNYTMLVAVANYSTNSSCVGNAKLLLENDIDIKRKEQVLWGMGGFMRAICTGDFAGAWRRADGSNREALLEALTNNEIEL
tara:strand:+ start:294 stop:602 length:309 start_codon:yes stop_codon:yes gene_type:complete